MIVPVVTGFIGHDEKGRITTLGIIIFIINLIVIKRVATTSAPAVPVNVQAQTVAQTVAAPVATPISGLLYFIDLCSI